MGKPSPLAAFNRDAISELALAVSELSKSNRALEDAVAEIKALRAEKLRVIETIARHVQAIKHPALHPVARQTGEFILDEILKAMDI